MPTLQAEVSGKCPFCGADIAFGSTPEPFATHGFPTCKKFDRLDVVNILAAVNRKMLADQTKASS